MSYEGALSFLDVNQDGQYNMDDLMLAAQVGDQLAQSVRSGYRYVKRKWNNFTTSSPASKRARTGSGYRPGYTRQTYWYSGNFHKH